MYVDYQNGSCTFFFIEGSIFISFLCISLTCIQGKRVYITANVKPDRELVASLVKAVHGQVCVLCCYLIKWPKV